MASAVDSRLAYARLSTVATASRLPTATRGSNNSYTTSWDTTAVYAAFVTSDGRVKPKSDESGDVLLAFFMLLGGYYFVALIGLGLGAGLLALGFALKESVPQNPRAGPET